MDSANYLTIKSRPDGYVYRYMKLQRLYELFTNRENVLVQPSMWDDPFENFILKAKVKWADGTVRTFGFEDRLYGQCWTTEARSDALWRIYSQKLDDGTCSGVRVRTSVTRLANSLTRDMEIGDAAHAFIGSVEYLSDKELLGSPNLIFAEGLNPRSVARTLLVKRIAFRHEKEVRLVYRKLFGDPAPEGKFRYGLDPHLLVDQIMLDPRVEPAKVDAVKKKIADETGFKGKIKWSLLYNLPKGVVISMGV